MKILREEQDGVTKVGIALGRGYGNCLGPAQQPGPEGKGLKWKQGFRLTPIPVPLPGQCEGKF